MKFSKLVCLIVTICLLSVPLCAESYWNLALEDNNQGSYMEDDSAKSSESFDEYHERLYMGYFIAFVPGFFVHGAGNMYGGRMRVGLTLFSLGLSSSYLLIASSLNEYGNHSTKDTLIIIGAVVVFLGTWIYDIATVDSAVREKYGKAKVGFSVLQPMSFNSNNSDCIGLASISINF